MRVVCTAEEEAIFATLLAAVKHFGARSHLTAAITRLLGIPLRADLPVTLRVAGGWVRDKLLGLESADIDIALDTMYGRDFAERVNAYLVSTGAPPSGVGVIAANPAQSKHLETATMRVHGLWLDLVHLRSETYADDSRIPTSVGFGTPAEDALRRDLTVNALFYNLQARCVEDHTGKGLADLRAKVARTPLPARETLLEDPLRALRAVRLASRLALTLDSDLESAASSAEVRAALRAKVSRERVGVEVEGMLRGPAPAEALRALCRLSLAPAVFSLPTALEDACPPCTPWACLHAARCAEAALRAAAPGTASSSSAGAAPPSSLWDAISGDEEARRGALLAAWLLPLRRVVAPAGAGGKPSKPTPAAQYVVREALKLRGRDGDAVARLHDGADAFAALLGEEGAGMGASRARLGRVLRSAKGSWRVALALAAALRSPLAVTLAPSGEEASPGACAACRDAVAAEPAGVAAPSAAAAALAQRIGDTLALEGVWELKPLLSGGEVQAALELQRAGPALGTWLDALLTWQLAHPAASKADATAWLQQHKGNAAPPANPEE
jgi:tRNA nucleotidyltransferase (CCA-adding enzyme)